MALKKYSVFLIRQPYIKKYFELFHSMKNNLEDIKFENVIDKNNISYASFRKTLHPNYNIIKKDILKGYLLIILSVLILYGIESIVLSVIIKGVFCFLCSLLLGASFSFLHLFIHEGAHYNLHHNKKKNDTLCNIFLCIFFGISVKKYRKIHWQHHLYLGKPEDTESTYFNQLTLSFVVRVITGLYTIAVIIKRRNIIVEKSSSLQKNGLLRYYSLAFHAIISIILYFYIGWMATTAWLTGIMVVFPLFASIRQILEHRDEAAVKDPLFYNNPQKKVSRLFRNGWLDSFIGSAGFNRHIIHHWDPLISYTRLKDVEQFLLQSATTRHIITDSKTSYFKTFALLFQKQ